MAHYFRDSLTDRLRSDGELALLSKQAGAAHLAADDFFGATGGGPAIVDGSATITATSSLTATGVVIKEGVASLAAAGTLTGDGLIIKEGAAVLAAAGSLSADAVVIKEGAATLAATTTLEADGMVIIDGSVAISALSQLDATGVVILDGQVALVAAGLLAAEGLVVVDGSVGMAGAAVLLADGLRIAEGQASLAATTTLAGDGVVLSFGATTLIAVSSLYASGEVVRRPVILGSGSDSGRVRRVFPRAEVRKIAGSARLSARSGLAAAGEVVSRRTPVAGRRGRAVRPLLPLPVAPPSPQPARVLSSWSVMAGRAVLSARGSVCRVSAATLASHAGLAATGQVVPRRRPRSRALLLLALAQLEED